MSLDSRVVMSLSAAFLGVLGLALTFAPHEVLTALGVDAADAMPLLLQLTGASLVGWALVNWTARGVIVGGIYARPLSLGNFLHFFVGACALGKFVFAGTSTPVLLGLLAGYAGFAVAFGALMFGAPPASNVGTGR